MMCFLCQAPNLHWGRRAGKRRRRWLSAKTARVVSLGKRFFVVGDSKHNGAKPSVDGQRPSGNGQDGQRCVGMEI